MIETPPLFDYQCLAQSHIRLLRFNSDVSGNLQCTISTHPLLAAPPYSALSYTWGTETPMNRLDILDSAGHRTHLPITPNIASALQSFYVQKSAGDLPYLWIDSICIDQSNTTEKSQQVSLMGSIYSTAVRVIIWLGQAENFSDLAMSSFPDLDLYLSPKEHKIPFLRSRESFHERGLPEFDGPVWPALAALSRRAWFTRLWVVQEVGLAVEATVVCGQQSVDWKMFKDVAIGLCDSGLLDHMLRESARSPRDGLWPVMQLAEVGDIESLSTLLVIGSLKQCSEPVDRIYGMLGLTDTAAKEEIKVDYELVKEKGYGSVYSAAAKYLLSRERDLSLLSISSSFTRDPILPSWCPNFQPSQDMNPLFAQFNAGSMTVPWKGDAVNSFFPRSRYDCIIELGLDANVVGISGTSVDIIEQVVEDFSWPWLQSVRELNGPSGEASKIIPWLERTAKLARETYGTEEHIIPDEYIRTLMADDASQSILSGDSNINARRFAYNIALEYLRWRVQCNPEEDGTPEYSHEEFAALKGFTGAMAMLWKGRVFITTKGGKIGAVPHGVRSGDVVCVLFGGQPVYVVRRNLEGTTWRYLGDAYVDGLMYGEVFDMLASGELQDELFEFN